MVSFKKPTEKGLVPAFEFCSSEFTSKKTRERQNTKTRTVYYDKHTFTA